MKRNISKKRKIFDWLILFTILAGAIFYLINYNFNAIPETLCNSFCSEKQTVKNEIPDYWLEKYDIKITTPEDLNVDIDNDGLTLKEEYKYFTNPLDPDTDKDGYNDGKEVHDGYNPLGEGKLDMDRDNLPDNWEEENGLSLKNNDYNLDPDNDGLPNYLEYTHLTNPLKADTDGDGYSDLQEIKNGYDPDATGNTRPNFEVIVNKLGIDAPIIWSKTSIEDDMLEDLKTGVVLFPKTGIPGQSGNAVISGHSSNYVWIKGKYNYIFRKLNKLQIGDKIIIRATQQNGRSFDYVYIIEKKNVVVADSDEIFETGERPAITLVTCWPLGTNWKRLMVRAVLEK